MHNPQRESFVVIRLIPDTQEEGLHCDANPLPHWTIPSLSLSDSAMKLFNRFRKILTRLVFSSSPKPSSKHRNSDRFDPPKTSCSSYYSSYSHYNEAISDCIEFFNKSAQDGFLDDARNSDVV